MNLLHAVADEADGERDHRGLPAAAAAAPAATSGQQEGTAAFGQRYTFPDGIAVEVKAPEKFTPSQYAAGNDGARAVLVTTTIINGSDKPYQFNPFVVGPQATHAGQAAGSIVDIQKKIGADAMTTILPGKSYSYRTAFSIGKAKGELQLQYGEDFGSDPAIFVGAI